METLSEKWFTFRRIPCKEGFIDQWQGDQADDPNLEERPPYRLNSSSTMFRLNGKGSWIHPSKVIGLHLDIIAGYPEMFSSDDLWFMAQVRTIRRAISCSKEECEALIKEHGTAEASIKWFVENGRKP